tara:strand:+ start:207 stop:611 length:405 start_codon:yes stop_codon:yes gene_type:complete
MDYEQLLDKAYKGLPEKTLSKERFEIPRLQSFIQGSKTVIRNFLPVVKTIKREERHVVKFFSKETATNATQEDSRLILNAKFGEHQVNEFFQNYLKQYVICKECGKPDTHFEGKQGVKMLKCQACGALTPTKGL